MTKELVMSRTFLAVALASLLVWGTACDDATGTLPSVASVTVTPQAKELVTGQAAALTATLKDADGRILEHREISWSSDRADIATVSASGVVQAVAVGTARISAQSEGRQGHAAVSVTAPVVASVVVAPEQVTLDWNGSREVVARAFDADGQEITDRTVQWHTGNAAVAVVSAAGFVEARGEGLTQVWATIDGQQGAASVSVTQAPVARVVITPASLALESTEAVQLTVGLEDPLGRPLAGRTLTWASTDQSVAFVTGSGQVFALKEGDATITATSEGVNAAVPVDVIPAPAYDLIYDRLLPPDGSEIFLLGLAGGTGPVQLDAGNVSRHPTPSPDGTRFVFAVSQIDFGTGQPVYDLFVVNRNGTGIRRLTDMSGIEAEPAWSPDGQKIAFSATNPATLRRDIFVINADGTGLASLTPANDAWTLADPAWSADGQRIAFTAFLANSGQGRIWTMRADGTDAAPLTTDAGNDRHPTWAPDGQHLAFHRLGSEEHDTDIMIAPVAGGPAARLALPGDQFDPVWSPDGHHIAFTDWSLQNQIRTQLYTVRPDGTGLRLRTTNPAWGGGSRSAWMRRP
jgi:Tol biopolymer transport system component